MPFVQPMRAVLPELDPLRRHAVAAPMRRARDGLAGEALFHLREAGFERRARIQRLGLVAGPSAELRIAGAAREIGIAFGIRGAGDGTFDADLPAQRLPMKEQRDVGVRGQVAGFAAMAIRIEDEAVGAVPLEQHHPHTGLASGIDRGKRHGRGIIWFAGHGFGEPGSEKLKGVGHQQNIVEKRHELDNLSILARLSRGNKG